MSWSYSGSPSRNVKDAIRFLIGDTREDDQLVSDEEISWAITNNANLYSAASIVSNAIATNFARLQTSVTIGPIKEEYSDRAKYYTQLSKELLVKSSSNSGLIAYAGGAFNDNVEPAFEVGMTDYIDDEVEVISSE